MRKTAIARNKTSVPVRYWEDNGFIKTEDEVLDFGCGNDIHSYCGYDPITKPYYVYLKGDWDIVICNYVLNVIKEDWQIYHSVALVYLLLIRSYNKRGVALFAIRKDLKESEKTQTGKKKKEGN